MVADEKGNISYWGLTPQIGPANFITGNLAQCFKKYQKDISATGGEIGKGLEYIIGRQANLTSLWWREDPFTLASTPIVVMRGARASFSNFKALALISWARRGSAWGWSLTLQRLLDHLQKALAVSLEHSHLLNSCCFKWHVEKEINCFGCFQRREKFLHSWGNIAVSPDGKLEFCVVLRERMFILLQPAFLANLCTKEGGRKKGGRRAWKVGVNEGGDLLYELSHLLNFHFQCFSFSPFLFFSTSFSVRLDGNEYC